jgi:hypothetical protein
MPRGHHRFARAKLARRPMGAARSALSAQPCDRFAVRQNNRCHAEADGRTQREAE